MIVFQWTSIWQSEKLIMIYTFDDVKYPDNNKHWCQTIPFSFTQMFGITWDNTLVWHKKKSISWLLAHNSGETLSWMMGWVLHSFSQHVLFYWQNFKNIVNEIVLKNKCHACKLSKFISMTKRIKKSNYIIYIITFFQSKSLNSEIILQFLFQESTIQSNLIYT